MTTPKNITELKSNQIFVFGSNLNGNHTGGAAKQALQWGAIDGQGEGLQGQTYAFPTLDTKMKKVSKKALLESKTKLYKCAEENKDKDFLVTKVGCGIAGFSEDEMKKIFKGEKPSNIILPAGWTIVKGYKAFEKGLVCRGFQYKLGKDFYHKGEMLLCQSGFHFCKSLGNVYNYYNFGDEIVVAEVESEGEVIDQEDGEKSVTNHLRIIRILGAEEAMNNTGEKNVGHSNTGHRNTGDWNTGNWNTGDWNTGDWNTSSFNTGCFNTKEIKEILVFNKMCNKEKWDKAEKPNCLYFDTKKFVDFSEMTEEEKKEYPQASYQGGYIKDIPFKEAFTESMKNASKENIELLKKLPNFDKKVFFEISGFMVD